MNPEQAILQLKNRAENLSARATTYQQRREAEELANITNSIIDHYNTAEQCKKLLDNAGKTIQALCEYIGIEQCDIDELKQMDANFLRRRLLYRVDQEFSPRWIFHFICTDYQIELMMNRDMKYLRNLLEDSISKNRGKTIPLIKQMIQDTEHCYLCLKQNEEATINHKLTQ